MNILEQLKQKELFTNTEQIVADYLLDHPDEVLKLSLKQLAKSSFSSESTIIRVCRKVGLDGYSDLKISLASEMNSFLLKDQKIQVDVPINPNDGVRDIMKTFLNLSNHALSRTYQELNVNKIRRAADMIRRAESVSLYGRGESMIVAQDFYMKLLRIGIRACLDSVNGVQEMRSRGGFHKEVAVVVSFYADSRQISYIIDELAASHVPIILLTGNPCTPLLSKVQLSIEVDVEESRVKMGAFASRTAMQYVLDCIYGVLFSLDYEKNRKILDDYAQRRGDKRFM